MAAAPTIEYVYDNRGNKYGIEDIGNGKVVLHYETGEFREYDAEFIESLGFSSEDEVSIINSPSDLDNAKSGDLLYWNVLSSDGRKDELINNYDYADRFEIATSPEEFKAITERNMQAIENNDQSALRNVILRGGEYLYTSDDGNVVDSIDASRGDIYLKVELDRDDETNPSYALYQQVNSQGVSEYGKNASFQLTDAAQIHPDYRKGLCYFSNSFKTDINANKVHTGDNQVLRDCTDYVELLDAVKHGEIIRVDESSKLTEDFDDIDFSNGPVYFVKGNDGRYSQFDRETNSVRDDDMSFTWDDETQELDIYYRGSG